MERGKYTEKKGYRTYNMAIVRRLQGKYGNTPHFVYASLRGNRTSETSARIRTDYERAERRIAEVLETI